MSEPKACDDSYMPTCKTPSKITEYMGLKLRQYRGSRIRHESRKVHYKVQRHIETTYHYVIISAGLGNKTDVRLRTHGQRGKGYAK